MAHLLDIIFKNGFVLTKGKHLDYSTMRKDGIFSEYTHPDGRTIYWGLNEYKKPPTLIKPRPNIIKEKYNQIYDDCMNEVLSKYLHEDIFEAMFNKNIVFKLK